MFYLHIEIILRGYLGITTALYKRFPYRFTDKPPIYLRLTTYELLKILLKRKCYVELSFIQIKLSFMYIRLIMIGKVIKEKKYSLNITRKVNLKGFDVKSCFRGKIYTQGFVIIKNYLIWLFYMHI